MSKIKIALMKMAYICTQIAALHGDCCRILVTPFRFQLVNNTQNVSHNGRKASIDVDLVLLPEHSQNQHIPGPLCHRIVVVKIRIDKENILTGHIHV